MGVVGVWGVCILLPGPTSPRALSAEINCRPHHHNRLLREDAAGRYMAITPQPGVKEGGAGSRLKSMLLLITPGKRAQYSGCLYCMCIWGIIGKY